MTTKTLKRYWPWWAALAWLLGYELYAVASPNSPTLSELYWQASAAWAALNYVVVAVVVVLMLHFTLKWWRG